MTDIGKMKAIAADALKTINWFIVAVVIILSYGFVMTNPSIGIDDENFNYYFINDGIIASGRWGSWLIRKVLNSYDYLPVWRDFFAVIILIIAAFIFVCIYEYVSGKRIDVIISTSIVSLIISYPIIAKMFIYIDNSVETAFCMLFSTIACGLFFLRNDNHTKLRIIISVLFLILGCALIENTLLYFCVEVCLFSILGKEKRYIRQLFTAAIMCIIAAAAAKLIGAALSYSLGIYYKDYASTQFVRWSSIRTSYDFLNSIKEIIGGLKYWVKEYTSVRLFFASCIFWIAVAIHAIWGKKMWKAVYSLGVIISSMAMYILTMNGGLPLRIFTTYVFAVVGFFIYAYLGVDSLQDRRKKSLQIVYIVAVFLTVFYFTKESNEYYQLDYKRYLRDADVAHNVNYELEKKVGVKPERPVVFIGQPEQYDDIDIEGEVALYTIYSNNNNGESIRIHRFFDMLGYNYPNILGEDVTVYNYSEWVDSELLKKALDRSKSMPAYPYDGYIDVNDDLIIIKLGEADTY